jgi:ribosome biogenesis GTPase / thiamine phosphate phosphatase
MEVKMDLTTYGWNKELKSNFEKQFNTDIYQPSRIVSSQKGIYKIVCSEGKFNARVSGAFEYICTSKADFPVTGDWTAVKIESVNSGSCVIDGIFKRKNELYRNRPGDNTEKQVLASNLDFVCIICGLDKDFNINRIERYLTIVKACGIKPVIVLSKKDLCKNPDERREIVNRCDPDAPVYILSSYTESGIKEFKKLLKKGITVCFIGSSGAGKSTLINALSGNTDIKTNAVREDDSRGRHTTTSRDMYFLPDGAVVIDTPGLREIQLFDAMDGIGSVFSEIEEFSVFCKFKDCTHTNEPGCAVTKAVRNGEINKERYYHYLKLKKEDERRSREIHEQRQADKQFQKYINRYIKNRNKNGHK